MEIDFKDLGSVTISTLQAGLKKAWYSHDQKEGIREELVQRTVLNDLERADMTQLIKINNLSRTLSDADRERIYAELNNRQVAPKPMETPKPITAEHSEYLVSLRDKLPYGSGKWMTVQQELLKRTNHGDQESCSNLSDEDLQGVVKATVVSKSIQTAALMEISRRAQANDSKQAPPAAESLGLAGVEEWKEFLKKQPTDKLVDWVNNGRYVNEYLRALKAEVIYRADAHLQIKDEELPNIPTSPVKGDLWVVRDRSFKLPDVPTKDHSPANGVQNSQEKTKYSVSYVSPDGITHYFNPESLEDTDINYCKLQSSAILYDMVKDETIKNSVRLAAQYVLYYGLNISANITTMSKTDIKEGFDPVNRPKHYAGNSIEPIKAIESWGLGFLLGNTVKYIARAGKKDPTKTLEDLKKAQWYLTREIANLEEKEAKAESLQSTTTDTVVVNQAVNAGEIIHAGQQEGYNNRMAELSGKHPDTKSDVGALADIADNKSAEELIKDIYAICGFYQGLRPNGAPTDRITIPNDNIRRGS